MKRWTAGATGWFVVVVTAALLGFDLVLNAEGAGLTYSEWIRVHSLTYPAIPFAVGVLFGHWFGPPQQTPATRPLVLLVPIGVGLILGWSGAFSMGWGGAFWVGVLGVPAGAWAWGQDEHKNIRAKWARRQDEVDP